MSRFFSVLLELIKPLKSELVIYALLIAYTTYRHGLPFSSWGSWDDWYPLLSSIVAYYVISRALIYFFHWNSNLPPFDPSPPPDDESPYNPRQSNYTPRR
ncbi:MAG: hypothetical protein QMB98_05335 [Flaviflexus sp.]|uniref:hypothetical protein n=1 Tax=Flaviflexus sp. TaxID=1969482 RepID=UPI00352CE234